MRSRSLRSSTSAGVPCGRCARDGWKYIEAPKPELYEVDRDPGETSNAVASEGTLASTLAQKVSSFGSG